MTAVSKSLPCTTPGEDPVKHSQALHHGRIPAQIGNTLWTAKPTLDYESTVQRSELGSMTLALVPRPLTLF